MVEIFDSVFHKRYVGGEGDVKADTSSNNADIDSGYVSTTLEDVLAEYRWYINDQKAELPESLVKQLLSMGIRTENDGKP